MKRIINGMTYNTDTATRLAQKTWESPFGRTGAKGVRTLYQTKAAHSSCSNRIPRASGMNAPGSTR
jgi:hypothetical protein